MPSIQTIILVHGFWADASCFSDIIPALIADGYTVIAVQNPLTSLEDDIAATQRALNLSQGNCLLVGHSWGGFVVTMAGLDERVAGLVYLAALAPDAGESMMSLMSQHGSPSPHFYEQDGVVWISQAGVDEVLANGVSDTRRALIHATQAPPAATLPIAIAGQPAWKQKPSWYLLATEDRAVPLALQQELADRMGATTVSVPSGHFPMISHPDEVLAVIRAAAA